MAHYDPSHCLPSDRPTGPPRTVYGHDRAERVVTQEEEEGEEVEEEEEEQQQEVEEVEEELEEEE